MRLDGYVELLSFGRVSGVGRMVMLADYVAHGTVVDGSTILLTYFF